MKEYVGIYIKTEEQDCNGALRLATKLNTASTLNTTSTYEPYIHVSHFAQETFGCRQNNSCSY